MSARGFELPVVKKKQKGKAGGKGLFSKKCGGGNGGQEVGLIVDGCCLQ